MSQLTNVRCIADYILHYSFDHKEPDITNKKLQILLYYLQIYWMITHKKEFLFLEKFEAWCFGPCIPEIYNDIKKFESKDYQINKDTYSFSKRLIPIFSDKFTKFLDDFLLENLEITSWNLSISARQTKMWKDARNGLGSLDKCYNEIDLKNYNLEILEEVFEK